VKRAIKNHRIDFGAIIVLVLLAALVTGYILEHQPAFNFDQSYYTVEAHFTEAAAVTSGQGQAVTIAGVQVGQIGGIHLQDGQAVVTMNIQKKYAPVYRNATVLLRPRTPLKDMYLALDPGTKSAGPIPSGGTLSSAHTNPDVDLSEILSSLDSDTRNYLVLLLAAGAGAFKDTDPTHPSAPGASPSPAAVASLQATLKRFAPLDHDTRTFASLLAKRQTDLRQSVHNLNLVAGALGGVDQQLASLIDASDTSFAALARNDNNLQETLRLFPGTLVQTQQTLGKVKGFATASGTTLTKLQPFARNLAPALKAARPLLHDTTPVLAHQLRPFSVALQPLARTLRPASADLKVAVPKLADSVKVLNGATNELAYTKNGSPSFLFYGSWLAHLTDSLVSSQDANGAILQGLFMGTCNQLDFYETNLAGANRSLAVLIRLLNPPDVTKLPGVKVTSLGAGTSPLITCPSS
jgi:phospholipid/cholesterol/gamma-HCH transport system substrate-binding protein